MRQSQRVENARVEIVAYEQSVEKVAAFPVLTRFFLRRQMIRLVSLNNSVERRDLIVDFGHLIGQCLAVSSQIILLAA